MNNVLDANDKPVKLGDKVRAFDPNRRVYVTAKVVDIDEEQKHSPVLILDGCDFWVYASETDVL